jgi:hypothetical protein
MFSLPECRWREAPGEAACLCRSPRFLAPPNLVAVDFCRTCCYADHPPPNPLPPALPCVHLGAAAAAGRDRGERFTCALHGGCDPSAVDEDSTGIRACARCSDYLPRDPFGPDSLEMLRQAEEFLAAIPDYPSGRFQGRGVVIAGGGRYFPSLYITVRALRAAGCRLPIQVWYLGRNNELPADWQALLVPHGVECVDGDTVRRQFPARWLDGWELKVFATLHCPFEEVLFLDADCHPCRNPEHLFDRDDYRAQGAIFWPDLTVPDTRLKWPAFGVRDPRGSASVESGQYLIHKRLSWRSLNLAWFYNDHSDYYYRYCHGDKHTFEVAWARCGLPFVLGHPHTRWVEAAYVHAGPEGDPLFVHRCQDKFRFRAEPFTTGQRYAGPKYQPQLPLERECWQWLGDLTTALTSPHNQVQRIVRVGLPGHFNCSLLAHEGRLLLASRRGWMPGRISLSELGQDYQPRWTRELAVEHPLAAGSQEDPRLFLFQEIAEKVSWTSV